MPLVALDCLVVLLVLEAGTLCQGRDSIMFCHPGRVRSTGCSLRFMIQGRHVQTVQMKACFSNAWQNICGMRVLPQAVPNLGIENGMTYDPVPCFRHLQ